ncbi:hypothetical protein G6F31_011759 [Rhizopus arrhizus]|nr:hypothetical protein G6F31_011759 [Rhizopus arrhizus]
MPPMPRSAACMATSKWNSPDVRRPPAGTALMRWLWFALGWVMVGLGVIGALLPLAEVRAAPAGASALWPVAAVVARTGRGLTQGQGIRQRRHGGRLRAVLLGGAPVVAPAAGRGPVLRGQRRLRAQPPGTAAGAQSGRGSRRCQ